MRIPLIPAACLLLGAVATAQTTNAIAEWSHFTFGTGIGNGQIRVSPVNNVPELLVPCGSSSFTVGSRYWTVLRHDAASNSYQSVFTSPVYTETDCVVKLFAQDVLPAAGPEVVVVTKNGRCEIWDQTARTRSRNLTIGLTALQGACLADVDADGDMDLVVCTANQVRALDLTGTVLFTVNGAGGSDITAAQMDADPAIEIATTDGRVLDGVTRTVQFQWQNGFGIDVESADIDGDGRAELVFAESWNWVWSFDIDTQLPKWSIPFGDVDCIALGNVDTDPNLEVLIGSGQWGSVEAYDTVTATRQWGISNPEHGTTSIAVGDVDQDGQMEVIWGAGFTSTGPDILFVAGIQSQTIEWRSADLGGNYTGPVTGDIDGDGNQELVCVASGGSFGGPRLLAFDPITHRMEFMSAPLTSSYYTAVTDLDLVDLDGSGDKEIVVCIGSVLAFNYTAGSLTQLWSVAATSSPNVSYKQAVFGDLDGNGSTEMVLGSNQYAHVLDGNTRGELWRSFYLGGEVKTLLLGDSDGDGVPEIHALSTDGNTYIFDGATRTAQAILQDGGVNRTAMALLPTLNFPILGDQNGRLFAAIGSATGYATIGPLPIAATEINGLGWLEGTPFFWIATNGRVALHDGLAPAWTTADYGVGFGSTTQIDMSIGSLTACGPFGISVFLPR